MTLPSYYRVDAGLPAKLLQRCSKCGAEKQRRAEYVLCGNCADRQRQDKRRVARLKEGPAG